MSGFNNLGNPSFGVQDSLEIGSGDTNLLNNLFNEEPVNPDDVEKITPPASDENKDAGGKKKEPASPASQKKEEEETFENLGTSVSGQELINSLFEDEEEEEEEEEEGQTTSITKDVKKEEEEEEEEEDTKDTIFSTFSKDLFKIGVFTKEEGEEDVPITTPEQFIERMNAEKQKGADQILDNFLSKFGEEYQNAFDAIFVKGVNPKQYFSSYNQIVDYSNLDMTKEENQVEVIKRMLSDQDFEQEDIDSEIERLKNYGDLESLAVKYHKAIVKKDVAKLKNLEQEAQRQQDERAQVRQQYVQTVQSVIQEKLKTKEFDGIPLSQKMANKLNDFLLVEKYKTKSGETLTDFDLAMLQLKKPENHLIKIKVGLLLKTLEEDPTLATIQKTGITKQTDSLFSEVARLGKKKEIRKTDKINSNNIFSNL